MVTAMVVVLALLPGFHEARALEPAASFVAGKPAHVYCANSFQDWWRTTEDTFGEGNVPEAFTVTIGGDESYFGAGDVCALPLRARAGKKVSVQLLAPNLLTLVHESIHQRGERGEGQTECAAMHEMPRVAVKFFHVRPGKQLRALMAAAWVAHRASPPEYQAVC